MVFTKFCLRPKLCGEEVWVCGFVDFTIQHHSALVYSLPCLDIRCRHRTSVKMGGKQKRRSFCPVIAGGMVLGSLSSHVFNLIGFLYPNSVESFNFPEWSKISWGRNGAVSKDRAGWNVAIRYSAKRPPRPSVESIDVMSFHIFQQAFHVTYFPVKTVFSGLQNARFHLVFEIPG